MSKWLALYNRIPTSSVWDPKEWLEAFPLLEHAKTTPQDPVYHAEGDVWIHTRMVVDALLGSSAYATASKDEQATMFLSALLHDVSKFETTRIDENGKISQPGHSRKGSVVVRRLLWEYDTPLMLRENVCNIVKYHQEPFYIFGQHRSTYPPEWHVRKLSCSLPLPLLCEVARADILGRICPDVNSILDNIALVEAFAREDHCWENPRAFVDDHCRVDYFRGKDVHPDYGKHIDQGSDVVVMCGLPASGKNTWVEQWHSNLPVVSFDDARAELGLRHGKNEGMVAHAAVDKAKQLLREGAPFVWNATHLSQSMRDKTLDLLYDYHATFQLVYLEAPKDTLLSRNHKRDSSLGNKDLLAMLNKWEAPTVCEAHQLHWNPTQGVGLGSLYDVSNDRGLGN